MTLRDRKPEKVDCNVFGLGGAFSLYMLLM
jgi:hypothetical protein